MKSHLNLGIIAVVLAVGLIALPAFADQIQIHVTGLDFKYDGTDIYDGTAIAGRNYNTAEADPLTAIDFFKNNVFQGSLTASDNIFADLLIDDVFNIPVGGGLVTTGDGVPGFGLDLLQTVGIQTTPLLSLNINQLSAGYSGFGIFVAVGGVADALVVQNLPFGLSIGGSDQISLVISSSNLSNVTNNGTYLTGFNAFGTGDINSIPFLVPEPSAVAALLGMAALGLVMYGIRRK